MVAQGAMLGTMSAGRVSFRRFRLPLLLVLCWSGIGSAQEPLVLPPPLQPIEPEPKQAANSSGFSLPAQFVPPSPSLPPAPSAPPSLLLPSAPPLQPIDPGNTLNKDGLVRPVQGTDAVPNAPASRSPESIPAPSVERLLPAPLPAPTLFAVPQTPADHSTPRGIAPMRIDWTKYSVPVILAIMALSGSAVGAPALPIAEFEDANGSPNDNKKNGNEALVQELTKQLEQFKGIVSRLEALEGRLKDQQTNNSLAFNMLSSEVKNLKSTVEQLQRDVAALSTKVGTMQSQSKSISEVPPTVTDKVGKLRFINEYLDNMTVIVNGKSFMLATGEERTMTIPAGAFTYQVPGVSPVVNNRKIEEGTTLTIRIHYQNKQ